MGKAIKVVAEKDNLRFVWSRTNNGWTEEFYMLDGKEYALIHTCHPLKKEQVEEFAGRFRSAGFKLTITREEG